MKKQVIIIAIVIFLISAGATLFTYNIDKNKFVGTWKANETNSGNITEYTYVFSSDGTISINMLGNGTRYNMLGNGTWGIENGKLVITLYDKTSLTYTRPFTYQFSNSDRTLSITFVGEGTTFILTKQ